jgi:hypothetical protein
MPQIAEADFTVDEPATAPVEAPVAPAPVPVAEPVDDDPAPEPVAEAEPSAEQTAAREASEAGKKLAGKKKSLQDRLDQKTWENHEITRRAEEAHRRAEAAERELESLRKGHTVPAPVETSDEAEPQAEQFDTYEKYVQAQAKWAARQELRADRASRERVEADRAVQSAMQSVESRGTAEHADFTAVLSQFVERGGKFNPYVTSVILEHPLGSAVAYALATDPETLQKIHGAPSFTLASVEVGKLLARLDAASSGSAPTPAPVTKAKPPAPPLGSSPVASDASEVTDDTPLDDHIRVMNAKDRANRRRL